MTLPLGQAYDKSNKKELTWEDYIHNVFRLVAGYPHNDDVLPNLEDDVRPVEYDDLRKNDLFAYSIWHWHQPRLCVDDTTPMESVFIAYRHEGREEVDKKLSSLDDEQQTGMRQALAALALRERRADALKMCLDHGFPYEEYFERAANFVKKENSPKTFQVIEESDFRKESPRRKEPRNRHPLW